MFNGDYELNINLSCCINNRSYGVVGLNVLRGLDALGHNVALFPIPSNEFIEAEPQHHDLIRKCLMNQRTYDCYGASIRIFHQWSLAQHVGRGDHIGFPIFELDTLDAAERNHLNDQDKLLVPSEWAKSVVERNVVESPAYVTPLGVDTSIFKPTHTPPAKTTTFLNVGKIEVRKGHDILVDVFNKAFEKNDDVALIMSWANPFLPPSEVDEWEGMYTNSKLGDKIKFAPWYNSQADLADLMNRVDCGIFPSRAEGWNLPLLEMMACGKHVIATNYSAHTEFCTKENSMLVDIDEMELAYDGGKWFHGDKGKWASIGEDQIDQMVEYMRAVHVLKQDGKLQPNHSGVATAQRFTWENTVKKIEDVLYEY